MTTQVLWEGQSKAGFLPAACVHVIGAPIIREGDNLIKTWLAQNIIVVQFIYGLSFFSLGLVVSVQRSPGSRYRLARRLWALAAFAFVHAFADWGLVFIPLQARPDQSSAIATLWGLRTVLGAISFGLLMHFGVGLLMVERSGIRAMIIKALAPTLTVGWLLAFFAFPLVHQDVGLNTWYWVSEVWSRYMLGLPSGAAVALGLLKQEAELRRDRLHAYARNLYASAVFFALYGLTAGLVVPRQTFWPASVINSEAFMRVVGIPVELVRTLTVIGTVIYTTRLMGVFRVETARRLYQSEQERAVLRERERIARDIHDGVLQTLYGVGLGLRNLESHLPKDASSLQPALADFTKQLGSAIGDLRGAITNLHFDRVHTQDLVSAAAECTSRVSRLSGLPVTLTVEGFEETEGHRMIPASFRDHFLSMMREGLSNAVRHSHSDRVEVMLVLQDETLILRIVDHGVGIGSPDLVEVEGDVQSTHSGLRNMRSRTEQLGGTFHVDTSPGTGTRLLFQIPLPVAQPPVSPPTEEAAKP